MAKHPWRIGTLASSTARAGTSYEMIRQRTRSTSSLFLISSLSRTFTSGRADHTVTGTERKKEIKNITLRISSRRNARKENSWVFTIGSSAMHDSERPWSNWVALKKWVGRWTNWRTRTTHTMLQKKNSMYIVAIGGYVQILLVHQNWWQSFSSSWWNWQDSWWHPSSKTSPRRWTQHWWIGETCENSYWAYYSWNESQN